MHFMVPGEVGEVAVWLLGPAEQDELPSLDDRRADLRGEWRADEHGGSTDGIDIYIRLHNGQLLGLCLTRGVPARKQPPSPRLVLQEASSGPSTEGGS